MFFKSSVALTANNSQIFLFFNINYDYQLTELNGRIAPTPIYFLGTYQSNL